MNPHRSPHNTDGDSCPVRNPELSEGTGGVDSVQQSKPNPFDCVIAGIQDQIMRDLGFPPIDEINDMDPNWIDPALRPGFAKIRKPTMHLAEQSPEAKPAKPEDDPNNPAHPFHPDNPVNVAMRLILKAEQDAAKRLGLTEKQRRNLMFVNDELRGLMMELPEAEQRGWIDAQIDQWYARTQTQSQAEHEASNQRVAPYSPASNSNSFDDILARADATKSPKQIQREKLGAAYLAAPEGSPAKANLLAQMSKMDGIPYRPYDKKNQGSFDFGLDTGFATKDGQGGYEFGQEKPVSQPVSPEAKSPPADERVFSDSYTGPRWTYGMRNRPLGIGTAPKGYIIGSDGPAEGRARHGTIQYPRELTKEELYDFEMEVVESAPVPAEKESDTNKDTPPVVKQTLTSATEPGTPEFKELSQEEKREPLPSGSAYSRFFENMPPIHRQVFEAVSAKEPPAKMKERLNLTDTQVTNIMNEVRRRIATVTAAAKPGGLQLLIKNGVTSAKLEAASSASPPLAPPQAGGTNQQMRFNKPDSYPMNPPQPNDFGIPQHIVSDLKRLDGVWVKSFDSAWSRCKPYADAWKKFKKALEQYGTCSIVSQVQFWRSMSPRSFESYAAGLLDNLGYSVRLAGGSNDHGVDIYARENGKLTVIQCKAYNKLVGPDVVRALAGTMAAFEADRGWLFTLRGGSSGAMQAINDFTLRGLKMELFNANDYATAAIAAFYRKNPNLEKPTLFYSNIPQAKSVA